MVSRRAHCEQRLWALSLGDEEIWTTATFGAKLGVVLGQGQDPEPPPPPEKWLVKTYTIRMAVLMVTEAVVVVIVAAWAVLGLIRYAVATGGDMEGLLGVLNDKWRGALILAGLLFYGTIRQLLDRLELKSIKAMGSEWTVKEPLPPGDEKVINPGAEVQVEKKT
jgi:hypothetical protein